MRSILFLLFLVPIMAPAQINRSAREFASEQVQNYVTHKLFKDQSYKPGSFGELKPVKEGNTEVAWTLEHKFEIGGTHSEFDNKTVVPKQYKFQFYLDHRMKVLRAEAFFSY